MIVATGFCRTVSADPPPPTLADPNRFAVYREDVARAFFRLAEIRRVDITIVGDSNVRNQTISGHEDGFGRAYSERFGCYATRLDTVAPLGSWAAVISGCSSGQASAIGTTTGPAEVLPLMFPNGWFCHGHVFMDPDRPPLGAGVNNFGLGIGHTHPIGIDAALRYHLTQWVPDPAVYPGVGEFNLTIREQYPGSALHNYAAFPTTSTDGAARGLHQLAFDVSAEARAPSGVLFCLTNLVTGAGAHGPLCLLHHRVERPDRTTGVSYSPLLYQGGRDARFALTTLRGLGPQAPSLRFWFEQVTRLQHDDPVLLIQIMHGGNDAGDTLGSLGPVGGYSSNTSLGHQDNLQGIITLLQEAWADAGFEPKNLYFQLGPYHPLADRRAVQEGFEAAITRLADVNLNTFAVRGGMLSTPEEFIANNWNSSPTDPAHLSVAGYQSWGAGAVRAIQRAICPADLDDDRLNTVADLFLFVSGWFNGPGGGDPDGKADFTGDGLYTVEDLFAFLDAWFAGC